MRMATWQTVLTKLRLLPTKTMPTTTSSTVLTTTQQQRLPLGPAPATTRRIPAVTTTTVKWASPPSDSLVGAPYCSERPVLCRLCQLYEDRQSKDHWRLPCHVKRFNTWTFHTRRLEQIWWDATTKQLIAEIKLLKKFSLRKLVIFDTKISVCYSLENLLVMCPLLNIIIYFALVHCGWRALWEW